MREVSLGKFGVDSGQFMIVDPCYVWDDDFLPNDPPTGKPYDAACRLTLSERGYGEIAGAVVAGTPWGDGEYEVRATLDDDGRIMTVTIDFTFSEEEEEEDWDEDEEDEFGDEDII